MRIDAVKRVLDSLPALVNITLMQGVDTANGNLIYMNDAAPAVIDANVYGESWIGKEAEKSNAELVRELTEYSKFTLGGWNMPKGGK